MEDEKAENKEMLAFRLGKEEYGIDILCVQEIRGYERVTRIANAPSFVKGVVNLRGVIVPIVDLRIKLNLPDAKYDATTVVIILNMDHTTVGMVVDSVSDVVFLSEGDIRPAPEMGNAIDASYLTGIGVLGERMLVLVDIVRLMSLTEVNLNDQLAA